MALAHYTHKTRAGETHLIRLGALRGDRKYLYALTPLNNSKGAYRQPFQITKVSNPAFLEGLVGRIRRGPTRFSIRSGKLTLNVVAKVLDRTGLTRLELDNGDILIISPDNGEEPTVQAMTELITFTALVIILGIVVVVGAVAIEMTSDEGGGGSTTECDAGGREEGGDDGGDDGGDGGGDGGGGDGD